MDLELFPLQSDQDVTEMCNYIDSSRVIYVYCESYSMTQEAMNSIPSNWLNFDVHEKEQVEQLLELEGIMKDFSDPGEDVEEIIKKKQKEIEVTNVEDDDHVSFHDDSSNIDSTDEDVAAVLQ